MDIWLLDIGHNWMMAGTSVLLTCLFSRIMGIPVHQFGWFFFGLGAVTFAAHYLF